MRLVNHLNEGARHKLTVISAPNGFGKSTAVSQWASQTVQKVAWLSLEKNDNDPGKFLKNFITSLQSVHSKIGEGIFESLQSPNKPTMESALKKLLDQIGMILQDFVVVLDDYHNIEAPPVHNIVSFLIDYLPPQMHLFIASESDPPLSLSGLRATDQLKEIRNPYLAFTMEEAQAFFNEVMKLEVAYGDITAIVVRTNARVAALKYAALCLQHFDAFSDFVSGFENDDRDEIIFLTQILLEKQAAETRDFLLQISPLEIFNTALCNAVTGRENSADILERLSEQGAFVTPLDEDSEWYQLHTFVQKLLYKESEQVQPEMLSALHLRASLGYAQMGLVDLAFQHALAARNFDVASEIIEQHAQQMLQNGELVTVNTWLLALPETITTKRPLLSICCAWIAIITGNLEKMETHLENATQASQNASNPDGIHRHVDAIRGYLSEKQ